MPVSGSGVKDRFFRVYSGDTPAFYVEAIQMVQPTLPLIEPRAPSDLQLDGGRATANMISYISDEAVPFQPIEVSFQVYHTSELLDFVNAFGNWRKLPTWTVGGDTWTGVAIAAMGTRTNSDGVAIAAVPPKDIIQQSNMVNLVVGYQVPADAPTGTAFYAELRGVVITDVQDVPEGNLMSFQITGQCYGAIDTTLTDWPAGTESIPS